MRNRILGAGILIAGLLVMSHGIAQTFTGGQLYHACKKRQGSELKGLCIGYIGGVVEADKRWSGKKRQVCIRKKDIRYGKFRKLMREFLDRNRHMHKRKAHELVLLALKAEYPCN